MIRDLEAVLLEVVDDSSWEFLREAVRCYHGYAYRAAVVVAVSAAADDLRRKLATLAMTGGATPDIRDLHNLVDSLFRSQDPFELKLIDGCEKVDILSPSEAAKLRLLLKLRHLCAHPSGHSGSPEEARDSVCTVVDLVLSRPALMGMTAINSLLDRLGSPAFFPGDSEEQILTTVSGELALLNPALMQALATKLVDRLLSSSAPGTGGVGSSRANARRFAEGLLLVGGEPSRQLWRQMSRIIESPGATQDTFLLLARDPRSLGGASSLTRERALALVRRNLVAPEARAVARQWMDAQALGDEEQRELVLRARADLVDRWSPETTTAVADLSWADLDEYYFEKLVERCGSGTFDIANDAIDTMQSISDERIALIPNTLRVLYLLQVARSARGVYASFSAQRLCEQGLGPRADFFDAFLLDVSKVPDRLRSGQTSWEHVAKIAVRSGRIDAAGALIALFRGFEAESSDVGAAFSFLSEVTDPELADQARDANARWRTAWGVDERA